LSYPQKNNTSDLTSNIFYELIIVTVVMTNGRWAGDIPLWGSDGLRSMVKVGVAISWG